MKALLVTLALLTIATQVDARSPAVRRRFLARAGLDRTPVGCQVDHWQPLHCGGPDSLSNLRLLCGRKLELKERRERDCNGLDRWSAERNSWGLGIVE